MKTKNLKLFVNTMCWVVMLAAAALPAFGAMHDDDGGCTANGLTLEQLKSARQATGAFNSVEAAEAAGYVNINLLIPHMGAHYVKFGLLDTPFEADKPEALVYADLGTGRPQLVAVEYLAPLSPAPPEGFEGTCDQWSPFGGQFWTLHAWLWHPNMSGTFSQFNPLVP
ncbi:MAG TPA: hypothetical protein VGQ55_15475 [Pyrinomonadaceae bacterium]|jgi:hypothetical protein|nr:hypothetical protein [Pyrinomonadaceae bacterium]